MEVLYEKTGVASAEARQPQIDCELELQQKSIAQLEEASTELIRRIGRILSSSHEKPNDNSKELEYKCSLAEHISSNTRRIEAVVEHIMQAIDRVEMSPGD